MPPEWRQDGVVGPGLMHRDQGPKPDDSETYVLKTQQVTWSWRLQPAYERPTFANAKTAGLA